MGATRRRRIGAAILATAIFTFGIAILVLLSSPQPAWLATRWPIDLADPANRMLGWRLAALKSNRDACRLVLKAPHAFATELVDFVDANGCGWRNGVRLSAAGGAKLPVDKITCELAAALALWIAYEVQPAARAIFGDAVATLQHRGSFACRNIRGDPALADVKSEHASANALDISGFVLASGRQVSVLKSWGRDGAEGEFLARVHRSACRYFQVAIGPAYNAAHRDHFHYDRGDEAACQ